MPTTSKQDSDFLDSLISRNLLEEAIDWIKSNLSPSEVFEEKELLSWAKDFEPEDVCHVKELERWAELNGFTKE